jgi:hypothetical protein
VQLLWSLGVVDSHGIRQSPPSLVVAAVPVPLDDLYPVVGGGVRRIEDLSAVHGAQRKLVAAEGIEVELLVSSAIYDSVPLDDPCPVIGGGVRHIEDLSAVHGLPRVGAAGWLSHGFLLYRVFVCVVAGSSSGRVAGPGLGEEQVAVLRLHVALRWPHNEGSILLYEERLCGPEHQGSVRTSENMERARSYGLGLRRAIIRPAAY